MENNKLDVLFITDYPAPYRVDLFNLLAKEFNFFVAYAVNNDKTREKEYVNHKIKYKTFWLNGIRVGTRSSISFDIIKIIRQYKYDVIIVSEYCSPTSLIAMLYMKFHNIPFVYNVDGGFVPQKEHYLKYRIKSSIIKMANSWITSGSFSDKYLLHYGANINRIYHYPFAFNYSYERQLPLESEKRILKNELGIDNKKNFLYVGRDLPIKNLHLIIKAFSRVKGDVGLYIIGVNDLTKELNDLIEHNNLKNVRCLGFKSGLELKKYYLASDALILFSKSETWGLVINEAMTNGCPVIASDSCIAGLELIKNGVNGICVEKNNDVLLSKAMQRIYDDKEYANVLSINAYNSMKEFNIEANAKKHIEIIYDYYHKIIK